MCKSVNMLSQVESAEETIELGRARRRAQRGEEHPEGHV